MSDFISMTEASKEYGVRYHAIHSAASRKFFPTFKSGKARFIDRKDPCWLEWLSARADLNVRYRESVAMAKKAVVISIPEAVELTGLSVSTIKNYADTGVLDGVRIPVSLTGHKLMIKKASLDSVMGMRKAGTFDDHLANHDGWQNYKKGRSAYMKKYMDRLRDKNRTGLQYDEDDTIGFGDIAAHLGLTHSAVYQEFRRGKIHADAYEKPGGRILRVQREEAERYIAERNKA